MNANFWHSISSSWNQENASSVYYLETSETDLINSFSTFAPASIEKSIMVDSNNDLPVELISFRAEVDYENQNVLLQWETAQEVNASHFILEKSMNGKDFNEIIRKKASGNSSTLKQYEYTDTYQNTTNYYRLVQVDFDGSFTIYDPIKVTTKMNSKLKIVLSAYPTPIQDDEVFVRVNGLDIGESFTAEVITINGKVILELENNNDTERIIEHKINTTQWEDGLYIYKITTSSGESHFIKLIK